jgi:hypothetical protein
MENRFSQNSAESLSQSAAQPAGAGETPTGGINVEPIKVPRAQATRQDNFQTQYYSYQARTGRIVGSGFAIAWSVVLMVFFNFYNQYIAYYEPASVSGPQWQMFTLITGAFYSWLPILNVSLALAIVGHAMMIAFDKYAANQAIHIILDILGLATVVTLLNIFPFDFSVIPDHDVAFWAQTGTTITLIVITVGIAIGILVRFIQLIVNVLRGAY